MNAFTYVLKRYLNSILRTRLVFKVLFTFLLLNVLIGTLVPSGNNKNLDSESKNFASTIKYKPLGNVDNYTQLSLSSVSSLLYDPISFLKTIYGSETTPLSNNELGKILFRKLRFSSAYEWLDTYELQKNLLTIQSGPNQNTKVESINELKFYDSDPRLIWSVYLDHLLNSGKVENNKPLPFSWYDWADFHEYNKLRSLSSTNVPCQFLFDSAFEIEKLQEIENEINAPLFHKDRTKYNEAKWYSKQRHLAETHVFGVLDKHCVFKALDESIDDKSSTSKSSSPFEPQFSIIQLYDKVRPEVFQLQARNHLLTHLNHPFSITVLNGDSQSFRIPMEQRKNAKNIIESELLHDYLERHATLPTTDKQFSADGTDPYENYDIRNNQSAYDIAFDHFKLYEQFVSSDIAKSFIVNIDGSEPMAFEKDLFELKQEDFLFDATKKIKELESRDNLDQHDKNYLESLKHSFNTPPALAGKYFSEASNVKSFSNNGWHRDKRFFNGDLLDDEQEYQQRLNAMIRTFQKFTKANGIISWLSHGTAYGYMYNGIAFPWDNDFDLQMPIKHLNLLAQYYNQSLIIEDPREGNGRYLVDVGTSITVRTNGNGKNNIDARFVDIDSGLYIDLTGLSVTEEPIRKSMNKYFTANSKELLKDVLSNITIEHIPRPSEGLGSLNIYELEALANTKSHGFSNDEVSKIQDMAKKERELATKGKNMMDKYSEQQRYTLNKKLGIFNCRNSHFSNLALLSPLRLTKFHGVSALVPQNYIDILKNEYRVPDDYSYTEYKDQAYVPEIRAWLRSNILKKTASTFSWYPEFQTLGSPITNLEISDLKLLYYNIVKGGYTELVGILYNSFNVTAYRVKELEIQASALAVNEKRELLNTMFSEISPKVQNPCKDPLLFNYERRLWSQLSEELTSDTLLEIRQDIASSILKDLWSWSSDLYEREYELFEVTDAQANHTSNFNNYGMNLFGNSTKNFAYKIFKKVKLY